MNRLSLALILSIALSVLLGALAGAERSTMLYRGDFPAFYGAAVLAHDGRLAEVGSEKAQLEAQNRFWPSLDGRYYAFSYPPYVAKLLSPLARFTPGEAKLVLGILMLLSLVGTIVLGGQVVPVLADRPFVSLSAVLTFTPVLVGLLAGQNAALSTLLYAGALAACARDTRAGDFLAGVSLGLWCFKPNFGLLAICLFALFARRSFLLGAALALSVYFALPIGELGVLWPIEWSRSIGEFAERDFAANGYQMVSLLTFAKGAAARVSSELLRYCIFGVGAVVWIALVIRTAGACLLARNAAPGERMALRTRAALLIPPALLLLSPHTLFYELGLLFIPYAAYFRPETDRAVLRTIALSALVFVVTIARGELSFLPLTLLLVAFTVAAHWRATFPSRSSEPHF